MYYLKKTNLFLLLGLIVFGLSSCYEEPDWLDENATTEGKHFPVIATISVDSEGPFAADSLIDMSLYYWSVDPINEVKLYEKIEITDTYVSDTLHIGADTTMVTEMTTVTDTTFSNGEILVIVDTIFTEIIENIKPASDELVYSDSLRVISAKAEIQSKPYASNFDEAQQADRLLFSYTVPSIAENGSVIYFTFEVINENGLTREKEISIDIKE